MIDHVFVCIVIGCCLVASLEILFPVGKISLRISAGAEGEDSGEGDGLLVKGRGNSTDISGSTIWYSSNVRKCMFLLHVLSIILIMLPVTSWSMFVIHGCLIAFSAFLKVSLCGHRDERFASFIFVLFFPVLARAVFMVAIDVYGIVTFLSKSRSHRSASASFTFLALTFLSPYFLLPAILLATLYSISTEQHTRLLVQDDSTPWLNRCCSWKEFGPLYFTTIATEERVFMQEA